MEEQDTKRRPLTGREARQGVLGRPVLLILIVSLSLALGVVIGALIWAGDETDELPLNLPEAGDAPAP